MKQIPTPPPVFNGLCGKTIKYALADRDILRGASVLRVKFEDGSELTVGPGPDGVLRLALHHFTSVQVI